MNRLKRLASLSKHPLYRRTWDKLPERQRRWLTDYVTEHADESRSDFEFTVNRLWLDQPKPLNHVAMIELLLASNTPEK